MELIETINNRRSIRHFIDKDINIEIIKDIINTGRLAPSAKNNQPWNFYIVKEDLKNKIASFMINNSEKYQAEKENIKYTATVANAANVLILIYRNENEDNKANDYLSIGACVENMLLRAVDLDIGALWIRHIIVANDEINQLLNIENEELVCALCLGYTEHHPKARPRKNLKDMITFL